MSPQKFKRHRFFHFTTKFIHPEWQKMSSCKNWHQILRSLQEVQSLHVSEDIVWHSGLLMSNHIHLIFSTQALNEHSLILELEQLLLKSLRTEAMLFQRPLPCEPLYQLEDLKAASKFIYRAPVVAGLVQKVEDYIFSSLNLLLNRNRTQLLNPFHDPLHIVQDLPNQLRWLNKQTSFERCLNSVYRDEGLGF